MRSLGFLRHAAPLAVILFAAPTAITSVSAQGVEIIVGGRVIAERDAVIPVARDLGGAGSLALTRSQVTAVQRALTRFGIDPGPHDGLMGPRVRHALRSFQAAWDLAPCGCLSQATIRALGLRARVIQRAGRSNERSVEILAPAVRAASVVSAAAGAPEPGLAPPARDPVAPSPTPAAPWVLLGPLVPGAAVPAPSTPISGRVLGGGSTRLRRVRPPGGFSRPGW